MYRFHSRYITEQHMAKFRYRAQLVTKIDGTATERESADCSQTEERATRGHLGTDVGKVS